MTKAQVGCYAGGTTPRQSGPVPYMPRLDVTSYVLRWLRRLPWRDHYCRHRFHRQTANPQTAKLMQGEGCFWAPRMRTMTSGHRSHHWWPWRGNQGHEVINLHPMLYPTMQLPIFFSSIQMHFGLVSKRCILRHIQYFGVGHWIRHNDYTLTLVFERSHWERRRWKNLDRILCTFYFRFF
jgi:hypothetical protein